MGYYELVVGLLFLLAILDLSVGVSNDAVNFLNSAIGSRVASRRVILLVAGGGVLAGSLFSSGIMEVARSGIFNPDLFVFADVMVIFLAVMLADVLLLDLFNTFALPTSTTVSIVFELLGAATAVSVLVIMNNPDAHSLIDYVKADRALIIISGILLSITVAFITGTIVQFFSRMLFTFRKRNHTAIIRVGWGAIAFTVISYFLIIKGLKGTGFIPAEALEYILSNAGVIVLVTLAVWTIVLTILNALKVDVLAMVVLGGTFSLALAFASNDLVNFIGVPLAGLAAFGEWSGSGLAPEQMTMEALSGPVQGNTLILLGAGAIMVATLWLSSKAQSVTQTEVDLGRQDEGAERFRPGPVSRGIVRTVIATGDAAMRAVPEQWRVGVASRFEQDKTDAADVDRPAFDTLRASVNLTVASILIVFATSLKLPLSTTFVSFMVAMGTSLADQAWGRDSAVFRLAGVFSVVGGWFVTALAAFAMGATFAVLIKLFDAVAVAGLVALAAFALMHSYRFHDRRSKTDSVKQTTGSGSPVPDALGLRRQLSLALEHNAEIVGTSLNLLVSRRRKTARQLLGRVQDDINRSRETRSEFVRRLNQDRPEVKPWLKDQFGVLAAEHAMRQASVTLADLASEHVLNEQSPPSGGVASSLASLEELLADSVAALSGRLESDEAQQERAPLARLGSELDTLTERLLADLYSGSATPRNTTLMLGVALELKDLQRELTRVADWR
ncbi:MAG: inorganic phosphate transporter, partial [Pseudomonadota bacterium]